MYCAEKLLEPTSYSIYKPSLHRIQKVLGQEKSKSNLEFRYQIIVTSIKFRKDFVYFMIDTLFKKFVS